MTELKIATTDDLRAVVAMSGMCLAEDGTDIPLDGNWLEELEEQWIELLRTEHGAVILAVAGESYVGMIACIIVDVPCFDRYVFVSGLWVRPDRRGGRTARDLMSAATKWATGSGVSRIVCSTRGKNMDRPYCRRIGLKAESVTMVKEL